MMRSKNCVWVMGVVLLGACGDNGEEALEAETPKVVVRTDTATAAECADGGSVVSSGLDANANGVLDDSEVANRTVLCDDAPVAPVPPTLVRLVAEPAGEHCAVGGTAVQSGPDRNGNDTLDSEEVAHVDYVCGAALLSRFAVEPAGAHCIAGGLAFFVGRDRDGDGALGDDEIEQTQYECSEILTREVEIKSAEDVAALAKIRVINGGVRIANATAETVALPALEQVRELLVQDNLTMEQLHLPGLRDVTDSVVIINNQKLVGIDADELRHIGGRLQVGSNWALTEISGFPNTVDGDVLVSSNPLLHSLGELRASYGMAWITANPALEALTWTVSGASNLTVTSNGIATLSLYAHDPQGTARMGAVFVTDNTKLDNATVYADRVDSLMFRDNAALTSLSISSAKIDGDVQLFGNDQLVKLSLGTVLGLELRGTLYIADPIDALQTLGPISIGGNYELNDTKLTTANPLDAIRAIAGSMIVRRNAAMKRIDLPTPGKDISVIDNAALTSVLLRDTKEVQNGSITITRNPQIKNTQILVGIRHVTGDVRIEDNAGLVATFADWLQVVDGQIAIGGSPALARTDLLGLQSVDQLKLHDLSAMTGVEFPALVAADWIEIARNDALQHLSLPLLTTAGMSVADNRELPSCEVLALFARIGGSHSQSGNDDQTTCPAP